MVLYKGYKNLIFIQLVFQGLLFLVVSFLLGLINDQFLVHII